MNQVSEKENPIDELARLMDQFNLEEGELGRNGVKVRFARKRKVVVQAVAPTGEIGADGEESGFEDAELEGQSPTKAQETGTPISSPMTGIFYSSSGPGSPPFVKVGSHFESGDVIGLIEAMKVFNEITATEAGTVTKIVAESSKVINLDEPILYYKPE